MTTDTDERIIELQTRLAFQDELLSQLNDALVEQQKQLFELQAQVLELRDEFRTRTEPLEHTSRDPRADIPPHY